LVSLVSLAQTPTAKNEKQKMEAFMTEYLRLWNNHDSAAIIERIYRLDANHPWRTKEGLQTEFDRLASQGYDHSDVASVIGCVTGPDTGDVELRFTRVKRDGTFMPPKDRVSVYSLKKFTDGWRAVGMKALPEGERMACGAM